MFAPEVPDPLPCGDPTCTDDHDEIAVQVLDGRGVE